MDNVFLEYMYSSINFFTTYKWKKLLKLNHMWEYKDTEQKKDERI